MNSGGEIFALLAAVVIGYLFGIRRRPAAPPLTPGPCECSHNRSGHKEGAGPCVCESVINGNVWVRCACQIFIPAQGPVDSKAIAKELGVKL